MADPKTLLNLLSDEMPLERRPITLGTERVGMVIVDEVNGFATVGAGHLAPPTENAQVTHMVKETDRLARDFTGRGWPVLAFLDTHVPGKSEPPYPPHCEAGTGEENLVPELQWLESAPHTTLVRKDCINGFVGSIRQDGSNAIVDWVNEHGIRQVLVVGICTDICVMDFVLTMLSARNHDLMPTLKDIVVYEGGCATYDLPKNTAVELGYGATASHPQAATHYMGLYFMASRGAVLAESVRLSS